ncbi:unnamed protein product [Microthlaspi erraticum]|uniref:F-box domain-containing protein n=1 Tax=Microthlaspi erraticum TaxID=1685480 RepID=A0A6D2HU40_9BRAS|nr:unnamed protein product [Microthlaspi erraticum]
MDRISRLPDELLCHVLSCLTTKEAALTSVLSKRWRNLFAFVPNLDLDDSVFLRPEREGVLESFMDFVDRVLALQGDSPINKFSLKVKTGVDPDRANRWICLAIKRGVLVMDLCIDFETRYVVPLEVFMSRTLVKLKITTFSLGFWSGDVSLHMLKTLALDSVRFSKGQLQKLLSACPVLEELNMVEVHFANSTETLSSASLKTLTIDCVNFLRAFSFDTPNLVCLNYSDSESDDYPLVNLRSLVEAHIKIRVYYQQLDDLQTRSGDWTKDDIYRFGNVLKLVLGICHVQKLYLSHGAFQVIAVSSQAMPVFNNLTFLDIDTSMDIGWQAMPVLLRNFPHLDTLVITQLLHCVTDKCGDVCICKSREEKGRSLMSCPVKRLEIREFDGLTRDLEMVKHFLDYLPCLKEMEIYIAKRHRFTAPLVSEFNPEMLTRYNDLSGRSPNVKFKVHGSLPWIAQ